MQLFCSKSSTRCDSNGTDNGHVPDIKCYFVLSVELFPDSTIGKGSMPSHQHDPNT